MRRVATFLVAIACMMCAALATTPAYAQDGTTAKCHRFSGAEVSFPQLEADPDGWICSDDKWTSTQPVAWLSFDITRAPPENRPTEFLARIHHFASITLLAVDRDGTVRKARFLPGDVQFTRTGPYFVLPLPTVEPDTVRIVARVERGHSMIGLVQSQVVPPSDLRPWSDLSFGLAMLVLGMLLMPLVFDLAVFSVLRERFALMHAGMVCAMIVYVAASSGVVTMLGAMSSSTVPRLATGGWVVGSAFAAMFAHDLIEPGKLGPRVRRMLRISAVYILLVPGLFAMQLHATHAIDNAGYFLSAIPVVLLYGWVLTQALGRGSVAARYLALAWVPILAAVVDQSLRGLGVYAGPAELNQVIYVALALEVIIVTLGVADRFLALKRERDGARTEARALERLSQKDPLTGLLNRRAIEERFDELRAEGFNTMALLDLDRFKAINDTFGHQVGDEVLRSCAAALRTDGDRETVAVRLGGEEFLLLLKGKHAGRRAEAMRQQIARVVANEVAGLDRPVTASMGMIQIPATGMEKMRFADLYARADKLLYEAKQAGRNRCVRERLEVFAAATPGQRRKAA